MFYKLVFPSISQNLDSRQIVVYLLFHSRFPFLLQNVVLFPAYFMVTEFRYSIHPLEMSPAELAAADANQSLRRRNEAYSAEDAVILAWAKAVDSRSKQNSRMGNTESASVET